MGRLATGIIALALSLSATAAPAEPAEPATSEPPRFDLTPHYLGTPEIAAAYDLYKEGHPGTALEGLEAALARMPEDDPDRLPLTYLAAVVARAARQHRRAAEHLAVAATCPPVADIAHLTLGKRARKQGAVDDAIAHFRAVRPGGPGFVSASRQLAGMYRSAGRHAEARAALERALDACKLTERPAVLLSLADTLLSLRQKSAARAVLEALWMAHPRSSAARTAEKRLARLKARPSRIAQMARMVSSATGYNARKLLKELKAMRRRLRGRENRAILAYAEGVVMAQRRGTRAQSLKRFRSAWRGTRKKELKAWILLGWAEALERDGDEATARNKLGELLRKHPRHAAGPRARLVLARLESQRGERGAAREVLRSFVRKHPDHRELPEALWQLGWLRFRDGEWDAARETFGELNTRFGHRQADFGVSTWGERAAYWQARCLDGAGEPARAVDAWAAMVERTSLTYYAHLARSRLAERAPERLPDRAARVPLSHDPLRSLADLRHLRLRRDPRLATAVALVRLGLYEAASKDLEYRLAAGDVPPDGLVLAGALRLRMGNLSQAHRLLRRYGRHAGSAEDLRAEYWKLAYPLAFFDHAGTYGRDFGVSPFLVMGIVRHESGFRTDVRSYASAVGLAQLLPKTAQSIAKRLLQIPPPSARDLTNPALNLLLATRYLRELSSLFQGNLALAVGAYNTGAGRMKGWWRQARARGVTATDEFVEEMPYSRTASYTKKVLASYAAYSFLYGDPADPLHAAAPLPRGLPEELGPYMVRSEEMLGPETVPAAPAEPPAEG